LPLPESNDNCGASSAAPFGAQVIKGAGGDEAATIAEARRNTDDVSILGILDRARQESLGSRSTQMSRCDEMFRSFGWNWRGPTGAWTKGSEAP
jgi:hypothetical protein